MSFNLELGSIQRDKITGFEGIVTARIEYLTGCVQYKLTPQSLTREGAIREDQWFDEVRLAAVDSNPGGPFGGEPRPGTPD